MAKPFLSGAQGDPIRTQRRIAPQTTKGVPPLEAAFEDFRSNAGGLGIEATGYDRQVIQLAGIPGRQLVGKFGIGQGPIEIGDVDPANIGMLRLLNNVLTAHVKTTSETTANKYIFDLLQTSVVAAAYFALLNDNDVLPRYRLHDMRAQGFTLKADVNQNLTIAFPVAAPEFDFHGPVSQTIGSGSSVPIFRRSSSKNLDPDATDSDLFIDFTAEGGGAFTWRGKVGTAAAYSASNAGQAYDEWFDYRDENGDLVGTHEEHVMVYVPTSPGITALDEFECIKRRARWSPTLPTEQPLSSVQSLFYVDGVPTRVEGGWELTYSYPVFEQRQDVSGKQGGVVRRAGSPSAILTLSRDVVDLEFQERLLLASEVSVVIDARNNSIIAGATSRHYRFLVMLPSMLPTGSSYDTAVGGQNIEEPITLTAFAPSAQFDYVADGDTFSTSAHCAIGVETDIDL